MNNEIVYQEIKKLRMLFGSGYIGFHAEWTIKLVPSSQKDCGQAIYWGCWWKNNKFVTTERVVYQLLESLPDGERIDLASFRWYRFPCEISKDNPFDSRSNSLTVPDLSNKKVRAIRRRTQSTRSNGVVYFVQGTLVPLIKIGIASNVNSRLWALQSSSPDELKLLATVQGGGQIELDLHDRFQHLRVRGEWFQPAPELLEYIETLTLPPAELEAQVTTQGE